MSGTKRKRLDWHPDAIAELAESLAWYAKRNPAAARRMRKAIEKATHSLIASPIPVSGRLGVVTGTRELPVGQRVPFTLIFVRHSPSGDCTIFHCMHQRRKYPADESE
ncbi:MAG: type II toxin-antitoxin system RelE/ParE family toxin [Nitrosomonadales bacterium]|nr:type II toxin-antitoxin system RelE/ParE family toxin [Nitrosomonadales bacterium]